MTILQRLKEDHQLITRFLDNLYLSHEFLVNDKPVPTSVFKKALDFTKNFMNAFHHYREEYILFIKLAEKKGGDVDGQLIALRDQHESGRNLIAQIKNSLAKYEKGKKEADKQLAAAAGAYVTLMQQHIHEENHVFYPLSEKVLSEEEFKFLEEEFDRFEENQGKGIYQGAVALVASIEADLKGKFGAVYRDQYEALVKDRGHVH